ncbi:hypothetical protein [Pantoea agglomerans]|uniref:hypothetical protein n=1 Tax=Enterobacter agglomerans TaxID=549 RepID=UPI0032090A7C
MVKSIIYCNTEEEFLFKKYDINETDEHGMNALFHSDLVKSKWLIKHGIDMYHLDHEHNNVIMNISSGNIDKAKYLLDIGYDLSDFVKNPEKLILGKMRSSLVGNLVMTYLPKYFKKISHKERDTIAIMLTHEEMAFKSSSKKRRL